VAVGNPCVSSSTLNNRICFNFSAIHRDTCNDDWPLDDHQQHLLAHPVLRDGLNLTDGFLDELVFVECISNEQRNTVASLRKDECYDGFIRILRRRSLSDYKRFFRCVEENQPQKIIDIFTSTEGALIHDVFIHSVYLSIPKLFVKGKYL
jgi:hypothetical protein